MSDFIVSLGVDPGFACAGFGVVKRSNGLYTAEHIELVETKRAKDAKKRGIRMTDDDVRRMSELAKIIDSLFQAFSPKLVGVEAFSVFSAKGAGVKAAYSYAITVGLAAVYDVPVYAYTPQEIKVAMTKNKSSTKIEVQTAVEKDYIKGIEWNAPKSKQEHVGDAVALAIMAIRERDNMIKQLALDV